MTPTFDLALSVLKDELDTLASDPDWANAIQGETEILGVNKLDDSAVVLRARLTTSAGDRWARPSRGVETHQEPL